MARAAFSEVKGSQHQQPLEWEEHPRGGGEEKETVRAAWPCAEETHWAAWCVEEERERQP